MISAQIPFFTRTFHLANVRLLNTSFAQKKESSRDRIWSRWMIQSPEDGLVRLKAQTLPVQRFEDCIQLMLKHYLNDEVNENKPATTDIAAALPNIKQYLSALLSQPTTHTHVYLLDDDTKEPEIIGFSSMLLISKDDDLPILEEDAKKTKETKKFIAIYDALTELFPAREVLERYNVDCYYQDLGLGFTPRYKTLGIAKYDDSVRRLVCQAHGVPVTTAWCVAPNEPRGAGAWAPVWRAAGARLAGRLGLPPRACTLMASRTL